MLSLLLIFLLLGVTLAVFLGAGGYWFQGQIYNEPIPDIIWRGPAAAGVITLFLLFWAWVDYNALPPGKYSTLFTFSPTETKEFAELRAVVLKDGKDVVGDYRMRKTSQGLSEYRNMASPYSPLPRHPEAIIVRDNDEEVRFEPERDENNKFKIQYGRSLLYIDSAGRVMSEDSVGKVSTFRWGVFLGNVFLNLAHLAVWFGCLWLLLRFVWSHALGLAVVFWLAMTLIVVPLLLNKVEDVARQRMAESRQVAER